MEFEDSKNYQNGQRLLNSESPRRADKFDILNFFFRHRMQKLRSFYGFINAPRVSVARAHRSYWRRTHLHAPPILSTIGGAYDHMRLAYSATYLHPGPRNLWEAHSHHMRLAYLKYRRRMPTICASHKLGLPGFVRTGNRGGAPCVYAPPIFIYLRRMERWCASSIL